MFFKRSQAGPGFAGSGVLRLLPLFGLLLILGGLLLVPGCGGGSDSSKENLVLAVVNDHEITGAYYESKLAKLEKKELPKDEDGQPLDMGQLSGKKEFLQTLINKELMAQKALQLGYGNDPQIVNIRNSMISYEANLALWAKAVAEPSNTITPKELEDFYARMGEVRRCNYLITNFREDAEAAGQMSQEGADWGEVVAKYHDGVEPPSGKYELSIPYGRFDLSFDTDVFEAEVGGVTPPILTVNGFWVMKVLSIEDKGKPDLEEAKAQILDVVHNRQISLGRKELVEQVRAANEFFINEDVLWTCYQGLPQGEILIDPVTQEATPKSELLPLDIKPSDMGRVFFGYRTDGEMEEYTLGDYKARFDRMSVFQRPKATDMLGGLRQKITSEVDKVLMNREAKKRGFFEDPEVVEKVQAKVEEMMVTKLFDEVVTFDEKISSADLQEFWQEHESDYFVPEVRSGRQVICRDEETAAAALKDLEAGLSWREILTQYGIDRNNKSQSGKLTNVRRDSAGPVSEALFALSVDGISEPVALGNGRFALVQMVAVEPGYQQELQGITEAVGQRMKQLRKEEAFQALLGKWAEEFVVTRFEDRLTEVASWEELTATEPLGEPIPRN